MPAVAAPAPSRARRLLRPAALGAVPALLVGPMILAGTWPRTHDGLRHLRLAEEFGEAFSHGVLYPRWLPDLAGGYGYPTFVFYQPGWFFLHALVSRALPDTLLATQAVVLLLLLAGSVGADRLGRAIAGTVAAGRFAAVLFLLTPYVCVELFVRGDLSELGAMMAVPWALLFLVRMREEAAAGRIRTRTLAGASAALAAVTFLHPFVALFLGPAFAAAALLSLGGMRRASALRFLLGTGAALALGAALAAPYWLAAWRMRAFVTWENALAGYYTTADHAVELPQLVSARWGFGDSRPGPGDGLSFQLGLPHLLLAAAGTALARRRPAVRALAAVGLLLALAMTAPARAIWELSPLRLVQFPWRALSVIGALQAACAAPLAAALARRPRAGPGLLVALVAAAAVWSPERFTFRAPAGDVREELARQRSMRRRTMETYAATNEFAPRTADFGRLPGPRGRRALLEASGRGALVRRLDSGDDHRIRAVAELPAAESLLLNQLYFPGWRVRVDGRPVGEARLRALREGDGRIRIPVPAGRHTLEARYAGPPGGRTRRAAFVGALAVLALRAAAGARRRRSSGRSA